MTAVAHAANPDRSEASGSAVRARPRVALGALVMVVICFAAFAISRMFPPQSYGLADDWRVFYAAAAVVGEGGNPYDPALIHPAEQSADHYPSVQPSLDDFANLPMVAWVLQPVTRLPFWASYALAAVLGLAAAAIAMYAWLRRCGWRGAGRWAGLALLSWPALLGVFSGQFDLILLAMLIGGMLLSMRANPGAAGALCMTAALVKPHILWPLPLLLAAAQLPDRRAALRCLAAAAAAAALAVGGGELLMPGSTAAFLSHLLAFGGRISSVQPDLAGLPGLVERLPAGGALAAAITVLGGAATLCFAGYWAFSRRARALAPPVRVSLGVGVGLAIWLVATPYAHPNDDVLLFPLLALVLGADAHLASHRQLAWALLGSLAVVAAFVVSPLAGAVLTVAAAAALWRRRDAVGRGGVAAAGLMSLAILPMVWPFHVLAVSLTPLAVLVVAFGGLAVVRGTLELRAGCSRAFAAAV